MKIIEKIKTIPGLWLTVLAIGIALGGFFIGDGIYRAMSGRTVTVKGLAERDVVADTAVWNIKINGVGGDVATLQSKIDADIAEIHNFLIDAGFAESDIKNLRVQVRDKYAGYSDAELKNQQNDGRYVIETGVMVRSNDVMLIDSVSRRMGELVKRGITITEDYSGPIYIFNGLNDIKISSDPKLSMEILIIKECSKMKENISREIILETKENKNTIIMNEEKAIQINREIIKTQTNEESVQQSNHVHALFSTIDFIMSPSLY